jgi:uncharacterized protein (DUF1015 family)
MPATSPAGSPLDRPDPAGTAAGAAPAPDGGLVVAPFTGVRFDPAAVGDLAAVTSPPYDVIDPDDAEHLERLDPHNVVRLILPRDRPGAPGGRYAQAAGTLRDWLADGVLRPDPGPALYVYEQAGADVLQRGLLAAVELRDPARRVVLPHEDVMAGPVADRLELMRATRANLEPILLVYDGGGPTAGVVDAVAAEPPLLTTTTEDGIRHRLWAVADPVTQRVVAADLAPRQALIADGHHRYATYRRLQAEHRDRGHGPWDFGLALLVDSAAYPLTVQAIHRVVEGLPLAEAVERTASVFTVVAHLEPAADPSAELLRSGRRHPFVLSDGQRAVLVADPDPGAVAAALPPLRSEVWRSLDASVLHALVLERLWGIPDGSPRTRYLHTTAGALRSARSSGGTAALLRPVTVQEVHAVAARGERMPRKSTSFGPKPRTGLVLRLLGD